jgi:uncharacterized protein
MSETTKTSLDPAKHSLRIVIPGGTGHLGTLLASYFHSHGHQVTVIARTPFGAPWRVVAWNGHSLDRWVNVLDGTDVLINLAGRSVNCRYGRVNRRAIFDSRIAATRILGQAIATLKNPPRLWMNASTATIYRHSLDRPMDEATGELGGTDHDMPPEWRFIIEVATEWEEAFFTTTTPGTRKIALRTAMVMSPQPGGAFDALLRLVRFGLGGPAAGGEQFVSWIHEADFIRTIEYLMAAADVHDEVNVAAPQPLPNKDFMLTLRQAWGRSFGLSPERWMLRLGAVLLRTETELILKSRRVVPGKLLDRGFRFAFPDWPSAAPDLVQRWLDLHKRRRRKADPTAHWSRGPRMKSELTVKGAAKLKKTGDIRNQDATLQ